MKWYYTSNGVHVFVRVFMHGANCGSLTFRQTEFDWIKEHHPNIVFQDETDGNG